MTIRTGIAAVLLSITLCIPGLGQAQSRSTEQLGKVSISRPRATPKSRRQFERGGRAAALVLVSARSLKAFSAIPGKQGPACAMAHLGHRDQTSLLESLRRGEPATGASCERESGRD